MLATNGDMDTVSLSHPRAITHVKDPIHNTITLTCFEREIADSEHFQRLHFVLQNSTTYIAYPANKNSRFAHSLGVMQLCGDLFTNALANATPQDLESFLDSASELIKKVAVLGTQQGAKQLRMAWKESISGRSRFRHAPFLKKLSSGSPLTSLSLDQKFPLSSGDSHRRFTAGFLVDTLWQAIRLCGIAHDIGHLPMSHSLEGAVDLYCSRTFKEREGRNPNSNELAEERMKHTPGREFESILEEYDNVLSAAYGTKKNVERIKKSYAKLPLHEKRSLYILDRLFKEDGLLFKEPLSKYRELIYRLSFLILLSSATKDRDALRLSEKSKKGRKVKFDIDNNAFRFMKLVVAGSVDGDRMDYTVRDGHSSGVEIGSFDFETISKSATLFRDRETRDFRIGFHYRALPDIERFFGQRYEGYKYVIYHRTSSRVEVCLQHALAELLHFVQGNPTDPISLRLCEEEFIQFDSNNRVVVFPIHFDGAERSPRVPHLDDADLRTALSWIQKHISKHSEGNDKYSMLMETVVPLIKIVLKREFKHVYDPFKDSSVTAMAKKSLERLGYPDDTIQKVKHTIATAKRVREECTNMFSKYVKRSSDLSSLVLVSEQKPKIYDHDYAFSKGEEVYIIYNEVDDEGYVSVKRLVDISPQIRRMKEIFVDEFRINCYFVANCIKRVPDLEAKVDLILGQALDKALPLAAGPVMSEESI